VPARRPDGPPPPPVVARLQVRLAKRGRLRFASHRDIARILERALRRSGLPVASSAGFSPHPKISYAGAAPTGAASEAEYLEIGLEIPVAADEARERLGAALPPGIELVEVVAGGPEKAGLGELMQASEWRLELPGVAVAAAREAVAAFLAQERVPVLRRTKQGSVEVDARTATVLLRVEDGPRAILSLVVRHTTPAVRPDDVMAGLQSVARLDTASPPVVTRLAQGPLSPEGSVGDPLAREAATAAVAVSGGVTRSSGAPSAGPHESS
jgi:radical SAM-linked protein